MSETEKMYELVGVEKPCTRPKDLICATFRPDGLYRCTNGCYNCIYLGEYPPFTAEKQLSLIKLLSKYVIGIDYDNGKYEVYILSIGNLRYDYYDTLEETLAYCINNLWQFLTEEDKQQIKEILE